MPALRLIVQIRLSMLKIGTASIGISDNPTVGNVMTKIKAVIDHSNGLGNTNYSTALSNGNGNANDTLTISGNGSNPLGKDGAYQVIFTHNNATANLVITNSVIGYSHIAKLSQGHQTLVG